MVRLDVWFITFCPLFVHCFNSNMVRLNAVFARPVPIAVAEFQYQYGAIRWIKEAIQCIPQRRFNFNMVRLDEKLKRLYDGRLVCFNSNMVRLNDVTLLGL